MASMANADGAKNSRVRMKAWVVSWCYINGPIRHWYPFERDQTHLAEFIRFARSKDHATKFVHDSTTNLSPHNIRHDVECARFFAP